MGFPRAWSIGFYLGVGCCPPGLIPLLRYHSTPKHASLSLSPPLLISFFFLIKSRFNISFNMFLQQSFPTIAYSIAFSQDSFHIYSTIYPIIFFGVLSSLTLFNRVFCNTAWTLALSSNTFSPLFSQHPFTLDLSKTSLHCCNASGDSVLWYIYICLFHYFFK